MAKSKIKNKAKDFLDKHKVNEYTSVLSDSDFTEIKTWISTGSYSLNRVLSGSYFKGFADNKLYGIAGPSGTGKTVVAGNTTATWLYSSLLGFRKCYRWNHDGAYGCGCSIFNVYSNTIYFRL